VEEKKFIAFLKTEKDAIGIIERLAGHWMIKQRVLEKCLGAKGGGPPGKRKR